jgi:hypothetical protein
MTDGRCNQVLRPRAGKLGLGPCLFPLSKAAQPCSQRERERDTQAYTHTHVPTDAEEEGAHRLCLHPWHGPCAWGVHCDHGRRLFSPRRHSHSPRVRACVCVCVSVGLCVCRVTNGGLLPALHACPLGGPQPKFIPAFIAYVSRDSDHTHINSLSLSLSLTDTQSHTHRYREMHPLLYRTERGWGVWAW